VYPSWIRDTLAGLVRWVETWAAKQAAAVVLAERSYADELPFGKSERTVILENKYQPADGETAEFAPQPLPQPGQELRLLYSGTISELNGVLEALELTRRLQAIWPHTQLTIIGFCQQAELLRRLREAIAASGDGVVLIGGATLVPHEQIVAAIRQSHLGLLPYRPHASTWRCRPTKLFEYLAHGLPVLIPPNPLWEELVNHYRAGIVMNFDQLSAATVAKAAGALAGQRFYSTVIPKEVYWDTEAKKLHQLLDSIW
jgi:glycosyltransferase involved in cell wall biosynthesis